MQRLQHVCGQVIVSLVPLEAEQLVSPKSVIAVILELIRFDLVDEPDTPTLLPHVEDYPPIHFRDLPHSLVKLFATITPQRAKSVPSKTLRVESHWDIFLLENVPVNQGCMLFSVKIVPEGDDLILAEHVGQVGDRHDPDTYLRRLRTFMILALA